MAPLAIAGLVAVAVVAVAGALNDASGSMVVPVPARGDLQDSDLQDSARSGSARTSPGVGGDAAPLVHSPKPGASVQCLDNRHRVSVGYDCVVWSTAALEGASDVRFGEPAVKDDFIVAGATLPGDGGAVYAFEARYGTVRWRRALPGSVEGPVAVERGIVHVATRSSAGRVQLHALAAHDGSPRWRRDLGIDMSAGPATAGDLVVVADRGAGREARRGGGRADTATRLVAIDARTGADRWVHAVPRGLSDLIVGDDVILRSDEGGVVEALDPASGRVRWRAAAGHRLGSVIDGAVAVLDRERLRVVAVADGLTRWSRDLPSGPRSEWDGPVPAAGRVFVQADGRLHAYRAGSGDALRPVDMPIETRLLGGTDTGTVYVWAATRIAAMESPHRQTNWRAFVVVGHDASAPAAILTSGDLVVRALPGELVRLRPPGAVRADRLGAPSGAPPACPPALERALTAADDGPHSGRIPAGTGLRCDPS